MSECRVWLVLIIVSTALLFKSEATVPANYCKTAKNVTTLSALEDVTKVDACTNKKCYECVSKDSKKAAAYFANCAPAPTGTGESAAGGLKAAQTAMGIHGNADQYDCTTEAAGLPLCVNAGVDGTKVQCHPKLTALSKTTCPLMTESGNVAADKEKVLCHSIGCAKGYGYNGDKIEMFIGCNAECDARMDKLTKEKTTKEKATCIACDPKKTDIKDGCKLEIPKDKLEGPKDQVTPTGDPKRANPDNNKSTPKDGSCKKVSVSVFAVSSTITAVLHLMLFGGQRL